MSSQPIYHQRRLQEIAARWDRKAQTWEQQLGDPECHLNEDQAYERFLRELARQVQRRATFCAGHGAIDAGCATGLTLQSVLTSFAWGIGVDISPQMIQVANQKHLPNARFIIGDCFALSALCPKAGAVFSRGVLLSHYGPENARELLRSAAQVLIPGGFICFDFLSDTGKRQARHAPENKTYYHAETVRQLVCSAGFGKVEIQAEPLRRVGIVIAEQP